VRPYPLSCDDLLDDVGQELDAVTHHVRERYANLTAEQLLWQPGPQRWGVGQCLVHLARLNELYRERLALTLEKARNQDRTSHGPLRGTWFGRWFTSVVGPDVRKRVQTPSLFRPRTEIVTATPVHTFLEEQGLLRALVERARGLDLDGIGVTSPASRLLRFRVSDAFRILVEHEKRHVNQADAVLTAEGFPGRGNKPPRGNDPVTT
jgi:hypothetical protein